MTDMPNILNFDDSNLGDHGSLTIQETDIKHADDPTAYAMEISAAYAELVQRNPAYNFGIVRDGLKGEIFISWARFAGNPTP